MSRLVRAWPAHSKDSGRLYLIECPGCGYGHHFDSRWQFNGNLERPTFKPSLLVNSSGAGPSPRCHSFVTDGRIRFLEDSTHELAGQTVELPTQEIALSPDPQP